MSDTGYTDPAARYVSRLAGYDQRLQLLERSHVHPPDTPVGAIVDWPGTVPPPTWIWCDGSPLLVAQYPDLFAVIGYTFGGAGATFNVPDLRARVTVGAGPGAGLSNRAVGATGGAETVLLNAAQTGPHTHAMAIVSSGASQSHTHGVSGTSTGTSAGHTHGVSGTSGGATPSHTHGFTTGGVSVVHTHTLTGGAFAQTQAQAGNTVGIFGSTGPGTTGGENSDHAHSGTTGGNNSDHSHTIAIAATGGQNADHAHSIAIPASGANSADHAHNTIGSTDTGTAAGAAHENMPPFTALNKMIRVAADTAALAALTIMERNS
jgi:microcystin-dependent protein